VLKYLIFSLLFGRVAAGLSLVLVDACRWPVGTRAAAVVTPCNCCILQKGHGLSGKMLP